MDVWSWVVMPLVLLGFATALLVAHVRAWQRVRCRADQLGVRELAFRRSQFRRRMQTSAMLAVLAIGLLVGRWIQSPPVAPLIFLIYWMVVLLLVIWMGLLAVADIASTKHHYGRIRDGYVIEQARLEAELRRRERIRGDGQQEGGSEGNSAD
ncbi:MAG TPA: hypothetical protein EYP56_21370 [Planctomycetaceae bacterium]|nr:hypothetical protein [Planctomycetaceae bacterium]HIQ22516.1 hypothetical protein [Planctomycetota bacterium]